MDGNQKKCEVCGQECHKNWFYKHMLDMHDAKFCLTCWEYLPVHEQEDHRKFHADSQYKSRKIRIENGQPIIINRKERASLTPIGSLKHKTKRSGSVTVYKTEDLIKTEDSVRITEDLVETAEDLVKTTDDKNSKIFCEFCGIEFEYRRSGSGRRYRWRIHIYSQHLKKTIDKAILKGSKSTKSCPIEDCDFVTETFNTQRIAHHYISSQHNVLGKKHVLKKYEPFTLYITSCI